MPLNDPSSTVSVVRPSPYPAPHRGERGAGDEGHHRERPVNERASCYPGLGLLARGLGGGVVGHGVRRRIRRILARLCILWKEQRAAREVEARAPAPEKR